MARGNIRINLKGGDNESPNGDLEVQVLDADNSDAIIPTANYAAIGSNNNNGTDGANITYTLDNNANSGDGELLLEGVDVGNATNIKVVLKDENGNESLASAAFSASGGGLTPDPANMFDNQFLTDTDADGLADNMTKDVNITATNIAGTNGRRQKFVLGNGAVFKAVTVNLNSSIPVGESRNVTLFYKTAGAGNARLAVRFAAAATTITPSAGFTTATFSITNDGSSAQTAFIIQLTADTSEIEFETLVIKP